MGAVAVFVGEGRSRTLRNATELLWAMTARDLRLRYQESIFGWGWTLVRPLALGVVLYFALGKVLGASIHDYPVFLLTGLFPWFWFQSAVQMSAGSFVGNGGLLKKVRFPRAVLPLSVVLGATLQFLLSLPVLIGFVLVSGYAPDAHWLFLPGVMLLQFALTAGVSLFVASLTVVFRDLEHLVEVLLTFLFYGTPILFSVDLVPESYRWITVANPLAPLMESWRDTLLYERWPHPSLLVTVAAAVAALLLGWATFRKLEDDFADLV